MSSISEILVLGNMAWVSVFEIVVVYSLDKLPDNGYGVASANFRLIYDSTEVECLSIEEGPISKEFTIH